MISVSLVLLVFAIIFSGLYLLYRMNVEDRPYKIGQRRNHRRVHIPSARKKLP